MIQDLHSHTYYSFCGGDRPETIVEAAIAGGIELFGITDHNYGIGYARWDAFEQLPAPPDENPDAYDRLLRRYHDHIGLIRDKYRSQIDILQGIEVATSTEAKLTLPAKVDISYFDYCLIEHLSHPMSLTEGDLFAYAKRCGCPTVGVAHTDLFAHIRSRGEDPLDYFRRMAEANIFWEMNVSYDSIHGYNQHAYMLRFFEDEAEQEIVRESGVRISIGFDGHRTKDYLPLRVADYCRRVTDMGIKLAFNEISKRS